MNITVIQANVSHAAVIASIGRNAFRDAFGPLFHAREDLFEYLEYTYDPVKLAMSLRKKNNVYLLAQVNGEVAGFAKIKRQSLNHEIESVAQTELQKLYVLTERQGAGIGSALIREVKDLAHEIAPDDIWLDTLITNHKAIRLYEENGFRKIGKHFFKIGSQTFEYHVMALPFSKRSLLNRKEQQIRETF